MHGSRFIITGFPRSRTAWLANLFTHVPAFCLHDPLQFIEPTTGDAMEWVAGHLAAIGMAEPRLRHLGISDSGVVIYATAAHCRLMFGPETKLIIVWRQRNECAASFKRFLRKHPYRFLDGVPTEPNTLRTFDRISMGLEKLSSEWPRELRREVAFEDLNDARAVKGLWDFAVPDEPFSAERFRVLDRIRMEPASEKVSV